MSLVLYLLLCVSSSTVSMLWYSIVRLVAVFFFKQKTAYEMRISDWSSDVCSSDLMPLGGEGYDFYPERRHLEHEFDCFWAAQAQHHAALLIDAARDRLRRIIFFQRPLKAPKVGGCTFFNEEPRLPKAHPLFQERRLYEAGNQLEITQARSEGHTSAPTSLMR